MALFPEIYYGWYTLILFTYSVVIEHELYRLEFNKFPHTTVTHGQVAQ